MKEALSQGTLSLIVTNYYRINILSSVKYILYTYSICSTIIKGNETGDVVIVTYSARFQFRSTLL